MKQDKLNKNIKARPARPGGKKITPRYICALQKSSSLIATYYNSVKLVLILISLAIIAASCYLSFLVYTIEAPPVYSFNKKSINALPPYYYPKISNDALVTWTSQAISDIYTFNFANDVNKHFKEIRSYFSQSGYDAFMDQINQTGIISDTINKSLIYSASSCDIAEIVNQQNSTVDGHEVTVWYITVPLLVEIQSSAPTKFIRYVVNAIVTSGGQINPNKSVGFLGLTVNRGGFDVCSI